MNRSNFLKALAVLVVSPSLVGGKQEIKPIEKKDFEQSIGNLAVDNLQIKVLASEKCNIGDLILSDLKDIGLITAITYHGGAAKTLNVRPVRINTYRYHNLSKFQVFQNALKEA